MRIGELICIGGLSLIDIIAPLCLQRWGYPDRRRLLPLNRLDGAHVVASHARHEGLFVTKTYWLWREGAGMGLKRMRVSDCIDGEFLGKRGRGEGVFWCRRRGLRG